jgi:hypothetical protein
MSHTHSPRSWAPGPTSRPRRGPISWHPHHSATPTHTDRRGGGAARRGAIPSAALRAVVTAAAAGRRRRRGVRPCCELPRVRLAQADSVPQRQSHDPGTRTTLAARAALSRSHGSTARVGRCRPEEAPARRRPESQKAFLAEGASSSGCAPNAGVPTGEAAAQGRRWPGRRHAEERQHLEPTRQGNLPILPG